MTIDLSSSKTINKANVTHITIDFPSGNVSISAQLGYEDTDGFHVIKSEQYSLKISDVPTNIVDGLKAKAENYISSQ